MSEKDIHHCSLPPLWGRLGGGSEEPSAEPPIPAFPHRGGKEGVWREECGVFGIYNHPEASRLAYLGLHQLQHRGQESAGIVSSDGSRFYTHINMGLVSEVFDQPALDRLKGDMALGHVRYGTAGDSSLVNAQPIVVATGWGPVAVAHNGNLTNAFQIKKQLEKEGSIFRTSSDTEVALHLLAKAKTNSFPEAVRQAFSQLQGAYSIVMGTPSALFAVRDPWGVRPLHIGKLNGSYVFASETCAFDIIGAEFVREVELGEIVSVDEKGLHTHPGISLDSRAAHCVFEFVYFARPDSHIFGKSVYDVRREMGRILARESGVPADSIVAVPDSAVCAAIGYSEESRLPMELGMIRSHYMGRTFIEPKQSIRDFGARMKYAPVMEALKGKRVVLIDDSIVRGTTSKKIVRMVRNAGAKEIHMRISSPPIVGPCFYGIDTPTKEELIASHTSIEDIRKYLEADSLQYLSLDGMLKATGKNPKDFCTACFTDKYPIPIKFEGALSHFK